MGILQSKNNDFDNVVIRELDNDNVIPDEFKRLILKEFILPYYKSNIEYVINEKSAWSRFGTWFLTTSTILIGAASILSFASSIYPDKNLNFVAGSVGMVALILKEFASYANSVDHIKTLTINDLLKNIGIKHSLNDSSKNFKKIMEDSKLGNMHSSPVNELDTKFTLMTSNIMSNMTNRMNEMYDIINKLSNNQSTDNKNNNKNEDDTKSNEDKSDYQVV